MNLISALPHILTFLGWLAIFLFSMDYFEDALNNFWKEKLQAVLKKFSNWPIKSVLVWTIATMILMSSAWVILIAMSFASSWILSLANVIWIILWANIWTTWSSILVAKFAFMKDFDIANLALPIVWISYLVWMFVKNEKHKALAHFFFGFGLMFVWMDIMKDSFNFVKEYIDFKALSSWSPLALIWAWTLFSALLQSSTALRIIALAAMAAGQIDFWVWIAIVIGSNIWTTIVALIASLKANKVAKQVAVAQLLFNAITWLLGWIFFKQIVSWMEYLLQNPISWLWMSKGDEVFGLAIFDAIFNIVWSLLFWPFIKPFTAWVQKLVPAKEEEDVPTFCVWKPSKEHKKVAYHEDQFWPGLRESKYKKYKQAIVSDELFGEHIPIEDLENMEDKRLKKILLKNKQS